MHRTFLRLLALMLVTLMLASVLLSLPIHAASDEVRFIFDQLASSQGRVYEMEGEGVPLTLANEEVTFTAETLSILPGGSNALYLSLVNLSNATALRVTYHYKMYAVSESESVACTLLPNSEEEQSFTLPTPYITSEPSEIVFEFLCDGEPSGAVTLNTCLNVSTYISNAENEVTLSRCHYNAQTGRVEIEGGLSYAATVLYGGETLALFSLEAGEDLHLSSKTPIARTGVSFSFSFSVEVGSSDDLFCRYVVAVVSQTGERIPLCTPTYPSIAVSECEQIAGFKGFHTETLTTVLDIAPDVEIVDVYLDRLYSQQSNGVLYAGEHSYYYFDESYVADLDRLVRNLTGIGTQVYLRFLVSANANGYSFTDYSEAGQGVQNKLPTVRSESARQDIYALTSFLCERYASPTSGRISGIVLGRSADLAATYSYTASADLEAYTSLYITTLNLIAGAARRHIPTLRIFLPHSDLIWSKSVSKSDPLSYYSELFLPSLLLAMEAQILEPQPFSVLVESEATPTRLGGNAIQSYGIDGLGDLLASLQDLNAQHPYLNTTILYSWTPDPALGEDALKAAYLLQYITLFQNDSVGAFLVDFSIREAAGERGEADVLAYLARYIDTDRFGETVQTVLATLGIKNLTEIFPEFTSELLLERKIISASLSEGGYSGASEVVGSYQLWNFTSATGVLNWYAGGGCTDLSVLTGEDERSALTARLDGTGAYADIAHHFATPADLSFAPLMCFELGLQSPSLSRYEVQLRLVGADTTVIASAIVGAGENRVLYFNLSESAQSLSAVHNIRLLARPLDGSCEEFEMRLYTYALQSETLTNAELAERVSSIHQTPDTEVEPEVPVRDWALPLVVSAIVVMVSAAIIAVLVIGRRSRRLINNKRG